MTLADDTNAHLDEAAIAAYLDRALADVERRRIEAHLVACAECRDEVAEAAQVLATKPRTWRWVPYAGLAAAAALTVLLIRPGTEPTSTGPATRGWEPPDARWPALALVAPAADQPVPLRGLAFAWRSAGADVSYRLVVTDQRGDTVWTASSTDTVVPAPARPVVRPGGNYFWYVDAFLPDGHSVASGVRDLRIAP